MRKKYEFTGEVKQSYNRVLHRIRRCSDGVVGGWIESAENLDQDGDCFVYDEATVAGDSRVSDNGVVRDKAHVIDTVVRDNGSIIGNSYVYNCEVVEYATIAANDMEIHDISIGGNKILKTDGDGCDDLSDVIESSEDAAVITDSYTRNLLLSRVEKALAYKYVDTENTKEYRGKTLRQIKRCSDGELGGWIGSGELDHKGSCWIDADTYLYNHARVADNSQVYESVLDNCRVCGDAHVRNCEITGPVMITGFTDLRDVIVQVNSGSNVPYITAAKDTPECITYSGVTIWFRCGQDAYSVEDICSVLSKDIVNTCSSKYLVAKEYLSSFAESLEKTGTICHKHKFYCAKDICDRYGEPYSYAFAKKIVLEAYSM